MGPSCGFDWDSLRISHMLLLLDSAAMSALQALAALASSRNYRHMVTTSSACLLHGRAGTRVAEFPLLATRNVLGGVSVKAPQEQGSRLQKDAAHAILVDSQIWCARRSLFSVLSIGSCCVVFRVEYTSRQDSGSKAYGLGLIR